MSDDTNPPTPNLENNSSPEQVRIEELLALPSVWVEPSQDLPTQALADWQAHILTTSPLPVAGRSVGSISTVAKPTLRKTMIGAGLLGAAAATLIFLGIGIVRRAPSPNLRIAFTATALAPNAQGKADLRETDSGWEVKLDTRELGRLDDGRYYEAWLEGPKGTVSLGTFHTGANVTLWAGVEVDEYETMAITIEQEDGATTSSFKRVLVAPLKP
jgi:Anti-sigma-K factor rskA